MTTFTRTWDTSYEASPAGSDLANTIDNRMREVKVDARERLEVDHSMAGDVDDGLHKKVTFVDPLAVKPVQAFDESFLYTKDVAGTSELFYEDEAANEVQLTNAGDIGNIPSGTKMLFFQAAAPVGWTQDTTHDDKSLRVVSGTGGGDGGTKAFTTTFGAGKTSDSHVLSIAQIPAHTHPINTGNATTGSANATFSKGSAIFSSMTSGAAGSGSGHNHPLTNFDLQYVDVIIATKD